MGKHILTMKCKDCKATIEGGPLEAFQHCLSHGFLPMGSADTARHFELIGERYEIGTLESPVQVTAKKEDEQNVTKTTV